MLDLTQLAQQLQGISQHLTQEAVATRQRLQLAQAQLEKAFCRQAELTSLQETWGDRLIFTAAEPIEPLNLRQSIALAPSAHTIIATDGSQIAPSHHEIAYCYLINVGRIVLHYGQNRAPLLDSLPEVFYRPEDLYIARQWGIRTEEWMSYRRTVSEAVILAELAQWAAEADPESVQKASSQTLDDAEEMREAGKTKTKKREKKQTQALKRASAPPVLAMVDGSLVYWFLEPLPTEARDRILEPILAAWERLRLANIPLVGYLSASRSGESVNFLRLQACPYDAPDCQRHCANKAQDKSDRKLPCQILEPLRDASLWATQLAPGQRSPFWRSNADILDLYAHHRIYFCYVHVGTEIARVEVPKWVVEDQTLLDSVLSLTIAQVQKGFGYPVALAEAHNQAVVRGGDRHRFFALLEQQMIRAGLQNVGVSYKEARKRGSIA
jgi:NurA domain